MPNGTQINDMQAEPVVQPAMQNPAEGQDASTMNVQMDSGLIDEGVAGAENSTETPASTGNDSMLDAKNAFAALLSKEGNVQPNEPTQPNEPVQPQNASLNTDLPDISSVLPNGGTEPQNGMPVMPELSEIIKDAVAQGMRQGIISDSSIPDVANALTPEPTSEPEYDEEFEMPDFESDEFYAQFTDNPGKTMADLAQRAADQREKVLLQKLKPLLDQSEQMMANQKIQEAIQQFATQGITDLADYKDDMVAIIRENGYPTDEVNSYNLAYGKAKSSRLEALNAELRATQGRTLADYMDDEESISQMAQNEKVKQQVIQEYLSGLSNGKSPQVISDGAGVSPAAIKPTKASNFREASEMFRKLF